MKQTVEIRGMHCKSCEILVESKVKEIPGVQKVHADAKKSQVLVYSDVEVSKAAISDAVKAAGYSVGTNDLPFVRANYQDLTFIVGSLLIFGLLYLVGNSIGLSKLLNFGAAGPSTNLAIVFTIGVTAGLSSCMALVGGLVLGASARFAEKHPDATAGQKFRPHLLFNLGRILSFFVLGGLIGEIGSIVKPSASFTGYLTMVVGLFMLLLGLQLLEIFPRLSSGLTLPKGISKALGFEKASNAEYSHKNAMILGALTFFLPCGFTQAMQIYAVSTGSFVTGALVMGVFALGTTPGLLGVGGLTAILKKGTFANFFYKFVGVLVILLSFYNLSNGLTLSGLKTSFENRPQPKSDTVNSMSVVTGDVQVAKATYDQENILTPKKFTFKVGTPVRIEILAKEDGSGCMGSIMIPKLVNEPEFFLKDHVVKLEFTPQKTGKYYLTCAMGLKAGEIEITN